MVGLDDLRGLFQPVILWCNTARAKIRLMHVWDSVRALVGDYSSLTLQ